MCKREKDCFPQVGEWGKVGEEKRLREVLNLLARKQRQLTPRSTRVAFKRAVGMGGRDYG